MRSVEWAFIHCCWCPYEKRYRDAHGEGYVRRRQRLEKCVYTTNQELTETSEAKRKTWNRFFSRAFREHGPAGTLILNFKPAELWENKFLFFKATQLVVLCYHSHRKHKGIKPRVMHQRRLLGEWHLSCDLKNSIVIRTVFVFLFFFHCFPDGFYFLGLNK